MSHGVDRRRAGGRGILSRGLEYAHSPATVQSDRRSGLRRAWVAVALFLLSGLASWLFVERAIPSAPHVQSPGVIGVGLLGSNLSKPVEIQLILEPGQDNRTK